MVQVPMRSLLSLGKRPKGVRYVSPQFLGYVLLAAFVVIAAAQATIPTKELKPLQVQLDSLRPIGDRAAVSGDSVLLDAVSTKEYDLNIQIDKVDAHHFLRSVVLMVTTSAVFAVVVALVIDRLS